MYQKANAIVNLIAIGMIAVVSLTEIAMCMISMIPIVSEQGMVGGLIFLTVPIVFNLLVSGACCFMSYFFERSGSPTVFKGILILAIHYVRELLTVLWNTFSGSFFNAAATEKVYMQIARVRTSINMVSPLYAWGNILMVIAVAFLLAEAVGNTGFGFRFEGVRKRNFIYNLIAIACSVLIFLTECVFGLGSRDAGTVVILGGFLVMLAHIFGYIASMFFMWETPKNIVPGVLILSYLGPGLDFLWLVWAYIFNSGLVLPAAAIGIMRLQPFRNLTGALLGFGNILAIVAATFVLAAAINKKDAIETENI